MTQPIRGTGLGLVSPQEAKAQPGPREPVEAAGIFGHFPPLTLNSLWALGVSSRGPWLAAAG